MMGSIMEKEVTGWALGGTVSGVAFTRAAHVRILGGAFANECGSVRELICVDPEPCYRVELDASRVTLEVAQSSLDRL
jgi:hypothetical protein